MSTRRALRGDRNQCPGCGLYFNSSHAFDKHRYGDHADNGRQCLTTDQMVAKGMVMNADGWWISAPMPEAMKGHQAPTPSTVEEVG